MKFRFGPNGESSDRDDDVTRCQEDELEDTQSIFEDESPCGGENEELVGDRVKELTGFRDRVPSSREKAVEKFASRSEKDRHEANGRNCG